MVQFELSEHARDMLKERKIKPAWVEEALSNPNRTQEMGDGTVHYIKAVEEHGGRHLRVVADAAAKPLRVVTAFFDRRLRSPR